MHEYNEYVLTIHINRCSILINLLTRVRDNDSQLGDFAIKYDLSGDPDNESSDITEAEQSD